MKGAWHGGKGPDRRREDSAKVADNWPTDWNAREREAAARALDNVSMEPPAIAGVDVAENRIEVPVDGWRA